RLGVSFRNEHDPPLAAGFRAWPLGQMGIADPGFQVSGGRDYIVGASDYNAEGNLDCVTDSADPPDEKWAEKQGETLERIAAALERLAPPPFRADLAAASAFRWAPAQAALAPLPAFAGAPLKLF